MKGMLKNQYTSAMTCTPHGRALHVQLLTWSQDIGDTHLHPVSPVCQYHLLGFFQEHSRGVYTGTDTVQSCALLLQYVIGRPRPSANPYHDVYLHHVRVAIYSLSVACVGKYRRCLCVGVRSNCLLQ